MELNFSSCNSEHYNQAVSEGELEKALQYRKATTPGQDNIT